MDKNCAFSFRAPTETSETVETLHWKCGNLLSQQILKTYLLGIISGKINLSFLKEIIVAYNFI